MADERLVSVGNPQVPVPTNFNPIEPGLQGVQIAMQLAAHKEQLDQQREELTMKREQLKQHAIDGAFDMLGKAKNLKGGAAKALFPLIQKRFELAGVTIDPSIFQVTQGNEDFGMLVGRLNANPELRKDPQFMSQLNSALSSPEELLKTIGPLNDYAARFERAKLAALASTQNNAATNAVKGEIAAKAEETKRLGIEAANQRAQEELRRKYIAAGINPDAIMNPEVAQAEAQSIKNVRENKSRMDKQNADTKLYEADIKKADVESKDAYRRGLLQLKAQQKQEDLEFKELKKDAIRTRIGATDKRLYMQNLNQVEKNIEPIRKQQRRIDKAFLLIDKPNVTYGELKETLIDFAGAIAETGSVIPIARERGLTQNFQTAADQIRQLTNRYVLNNPAGLTVTPETLNALKQDVSRIKDYTNTQLGSLFATDVEARVNKGFSTADADRLYDLFKFQNPRKAQAQAAQAVQAPASGAAQSSAPKAQLKPATPAILQKAQELKAKGKDINQIRSSLQQSGFALPDNF